MDEIILPFFAATVYNTRKDCFRFRVFSPVGPKDGEKGAASVLTGERGDLGLTVISRLCGKKGPGLSTNWGILETLQFYPNLHIWQITTAR